MRRRFVGLLVVLSLAAAADGQAQTLSGSLTTPIRFTSWRAAPASAYRLNTGLLQSGSSRHRARNAIIGGVIGAAAGVAFCTAMSTLVDDSARGGISMCPLDTNLYLGGAGFALGFGVGWFVVK